MDTTEVTTLETRKVWSRNLSERMNTIDCTADVNSLRSHAVLAPITPEVMKTKLEVEASNAIAGVFQCHFTLQHVACCAWMPNSYGIYTRSVQVMSPRK